MNTHNINSANWFEIHSIEETGDSLAVIAICRYTGKVTWQFIPKHA